MGHSHGDVWWGRGWGLGSHHLYYAPPQGLEEDCTAASEFPSNLIAVDELGFRVPLTEGNGEIKWNNVM